MFTSSRRNERSGWYFKILTKYHGIQKVTDAADAMRRLIMHFVLKTRGKPTRHSRLTDTSGDVSLELQVAVHGRNLSLRNELSRGLYIQCTDDLVEWLLTMMEDHCKGNLEKFACLDDVGGSSKERDCSPTASAEDDDQVIAAIPIIMTQPHSKYCLELISLLRSSVMSDCRPYWR